MLAGTRRLWGTLSATVTTSQGVALAPSRPNPTLLRRQIGKRLRALRESRGLDRDAVANYLRCQLPKVSKFENGKLTLTTAELRLLALFFELSPDETEELLDVGQEARRHGWWTTFGKTVPEWLRDYVGLESDASVIENYEAELIHGLLQTERYARAVIRAWYTDVSDDEIDRGVKLRLARQQHLAAKAPIYRAVINEHALRRLVGGSETMREQLSHLLEMSTLPNVTLQVLPFAVGEHSAMGSSFTVLDLPDANPVAYLEDLTTGAYLEKEGDVERYKLVFDSLTQIAMTPVESRELIAEAAKNLK